MNKVIDAIKSRRSIRKYTGKRIPKKVVSLIIEAGRYAPSSHNSQPWRFIVISNKELIKSLSEYIRIWFKRRIILGSLIGFFNHKIKKEIEAAKNMVNNKAYSFFYNAPLLVLICAKPGRFALVDCALAGENMRLAARSLGIGSCWIGFADMVINKNKRLMKKLGVSSDCKIMGHLIFGYPSTSFPSKAFERKKEAGIIMWL